MSRLLLLLLLQLVIVLSHRRYQGMSSRLGSKTRRTGYSLGLEEDKEGVRMMDHLTLIQFLTRLKSLNNMKMRV